MDPSGDPHGGVASGSSTSGSGSGSVPPPQAVSVFKRPSSPSALPALHRQKLRQVKTPKAVVLNEDAYVARVESIVERDFFPELEKMRAQKEYLDAADRRDFAEMHRLRERYSTRYLSSHRQRVNTPSTFETPDEPNRQKEVDEEPQQQASAPTPSLAETEPTADADGPSTPHLDEFLSAHTSEDNASFHALLKESKEEFRRKNSWMFKKEQVSCIEWKKESLKLPAIENQGGDPPRTSKPVEGWTYQDANTVFYPPASVPLTPEEQLAREAGGADASKRQIVLENTRFRSNPWKSDVRDDSLQKTVYSKKEKEAGRYGVDGQAAHRPQTPAVGGFKLLKLTPRPDTPGVSESPLMTWGEVEQTPYRLEGAGGDMTPLPMGAGGAAGVPAFSIQQTPKRDRIAHELAEKNSKFYRDKKGKAIKKARSNIRTPKLSMSDRRGGVELSPAAQRLATSKLGIRLGTDPALRAAYTPSPARRSMTPSSSRSGRPATGGGSSSRSSRRDAINASIRSKTGSGAATPRTPADPTSLTDDMLQLPKAPTATPKDSIASAIKRRPTAADFL